jgi:gliding motility-associated-like protein
LDDDGTASPLIPDTHLKARQVETNYINNISFKENFQFKVTAYPADTTLEPGDTLQLSATAGPGTVSSMVWSTAQFLNCTICSSTQFIAGKKDIIKKVVATNSNGCSDSAYSIIRIPPADDYVITISSIDCAPNDSLRAGFTICNQFKRGTIPAGLKVSFYDADPSAAGANLLGPAFVTSADGGKCESYSHIFKGTGGGKIFAVVNDNGSVATPVIFPQDTFYLEKVYTNDMNNGDYTPNTLSLAPADTLVLVNTTFPIRSSSTLANPSSISWDQGKSFTLSCYDCASPVATIRGDALLTMKAFNQYGCFISGQANIKVIPPDMTVQILQAACHNNDSLILKFSICMNNNYDSVIKGLPVSFYENDPNSANRVLLGTYYTTQTVAGNCNVFSTAVKSPHTQQLFVVVNDPGQSGTAPLEYLFQETDLSNNIADTTVFPFTLTLSPADTTVPRATPVQIIGEVTGGPVSSITWEPIAYLSCTNCLSPVASPTYPIQYKLTVRNEFNCKATGYVSINTFSEGIDVSIPNVFSPNADGHNDIFFILGSVRLKTVKAFSIFNRWGQKIFQASNIPANDPSFGWNGFYKGKPADTGAYVYVATIEFTDGHRETFKGSVVLIR